MSASTETVAFIAAGGAVAGSVVGSTMGGIMDAVLDRIRERRRARVGARMVRVDLTMAASRLKNIEDNKRWWRFQELSMNAWSAYEDALTARLDPKSLKVVTQAVVSLRAVGEGVLAAGLHFQPTVASVDMTESLDQLAELRRDATAAYDALAKLAGEDKVAGLLHE